MTAAVCVLLSTICASSDAPVSDAQQSSVLSANHPVFERILFSDVSDGEFFSIYNPGATSISLGNWSVSDGEGTLTLPGGCTVGTGDELVIARNATRFLEQNGRRPDLSVQPNPIGIQVVQDKGSFRLANDGDELALIDREGRTIDAIVFGPSGNTGHLPGSWAGPAIPSPGRSRIIVRQGDADTDSNADWLVLRDYRPGQSSFSPVSDHAAVTALLLPDHSDVIVDLFNRTRHSLLICTYEFDSPLVGSTVIDLLRRGVSVKILLEGSPAGGISNRSKALVPVLEKEGASIFLTQPMSQKDLPKRYSYTHSKYAVVDGSTSVILSENFVSSVFDVELGRGNRGWGAIVESLRISQSLTRLFESDSDARFTDICRGTDSRFSQLAGFDLSGVARPHRLVGREPVTSMCDAKLFVFPDCTGRRTVIQDLIAGASRSFHAELFYADMVWKTPMLGEVASPILDSVSSLVRRSDECFVCFDNNSLFSGSGNRNAPAIDLISSSVGAKCIESVIGFPPGNAPFDTVHNKGMVLDHRLSWISSVNWNYESACANREAALLVDDGPIASFYETNIEVDLGGERNPPTIVPELRMREDGSGWVLGMSGRSDDTGLKSVFLSCPDGSRFRWSCLVNWNSENVLVDVEVVDLWGNEASGRVIVFPSPGSFPGVWSSSMPSAGISLSIVSVALIGAISALHLRKRLPWRREGPSNRKRLISNRIYGCSHNRPGDDDKGLHARRRVQGRRHHSQLAKRSLPHIILPHDLPVLARRLSRRR